MAAPIEIKPTDLTRFAQDLTRALELRGVLANASSTVTEVVEQAIQAAVRRTGELVYDSAFRFEDGTRKRVRSEPGFYGIEGTVEEVRSFRKVTIYVADGDWIPASELRK